jgi:hypothetical protein
MKRAPLALLALVLVLLMVVVATAGLDNLPRALRASVASSAARLESDRNAFEQNRKALEAVMDREPELFADRISAWRNRVNQDRARLDQAALALASLQQLAKPDRRSDSEKVSRNLREFDSLRAEPVRDVEALRREAEKAIYDKEHPFDREAAIAPVRRAMTDWPQKRADLESRLSNVNDAESAAALSALAAQLYVGWDKMLLDTSGSRQTVRIVRTENGKTTSEERTEPRRPGLDDDSKGMIIEHKPAGLYDSEAERAVQHPAVSYIAPPGQSNGYGHWAGGVWHWLPQYLILSQLLHMSRGPITPRDYDSWYSHRPRTVPPPVLSTPLPRSGSSGEAWKSPGGQQSSSGWWKERPKGFDGSKYRSRGGYSGSRYQSRGTYRSFGRGRR